MPISIITIGRLIPFLLGAASFDDDVLIGSFHSEDDILKSEKPGGTQRLLD